MTQILTDFKRFERTIIWKKFWYGRETDLTIEAFIFKSKKYNLPQNLVIPKNLKYFLAANISELLDQKNRNKAQCNLP